MMRPRHMAALGALFSIPGLTLATACNDPPSPVAPGPGPPIPSEPVTVSPVRIAMGTGGTAYVTDSRQRRILLVDLSTAPARVSRSWLVSGEPLGIAYANGQLLVGNVTDRQVDIYDVSEAAINRIASLGEPVEYPSDIAVDAAEDRVFVLDGRAGVVKVFALDGSPLYHISGPGLAEFDLQNPTGITLDPTTQEVFVSDYGDPTVSGSDPRIKIFTYAGDAVISFTGKLGLLGQRFSRPQGLAIDASGNILVVEAVAGEVLVLDRTTGATLATLGAFGTLPGVGELWLPLDVIVDQSSNAFVTNNRSGTVEVFDLAGVLP